MNNSKWNYTANQGDNVNVSNTARRNNTINLKQQGSLMFPLQSKKLMKKCAPAPLFKTSFQFMPHDKQANQSKHSSRHYLRNKTTENTFETTNTPT